MSDGQQWETGGDGRWETEVYARLARRIPIDSGTKEIWLAMNTDVICLLLSAKALSITGIDDQRYWKHLPTDESRDGRPAATGGDWQRRPRQAMGDGSDNLSVCTRK